MEPRETRHLTADLQEAIGNSRIFQLAALIKIPSRPPEPRLARE